MSRTRANRAAGRRGFTLVELLVVVLIVVIVGAATIKVAVFDQGGRQVSEAARILQAALVGARDAAYRANSPRGIRLLPDPAFNGLNGGALAASRMISIESAPDYSTGLVSVTSNTSGAFLTVLESVSTPIGASGSVPNEPTSWFWNVRQGDKIRIDDSGRYYTVAGPMVIGAYDTTGLNSSGTTQLSNTDRFINNGPPGQWYSAGAYVTYDPNPINIQANGGNHFPEFLFVVNGQDDDGDGWVDEGFDGIDNDGDGVIDPAYNGIDDDGANGIDDVGELLFNNAGEFEPERFVGDEFKTLSLTAGGEKNKRYTIVRRPIVSEGAREVPLPAGVVIDLTTWNATGALSSGNVSQPTLPERSRLPVDPYSHTVDVMLTPDGQVMTASAGQSAGAMSSGTFPTGNMPFYHFWIAQREDVYDPLFGLTPAMALVNGTATKVPGPTAPNAPYAFTQVPIANPNYAAATPQTYLLPMPEGAQGNYYSPSGALIPAPTPNGPFLRGDIRLVTLFVKTGHVLTYDLGVSNFDPTNTNMPYLQAQFGTREAK